MAMAMDVVMAVGVMPARACAARQKNNIKMRLSVTVFICMHSYILIEPLRSDALSPAEPREDDAPGEEARATAESWSISTSTKKSDTATNHQVSISDDKTMIKANDNDSPVWWVHLLAAYPHR
jgi:hypothetical protein